MMPQWLPGIHSFDRQEAVLFPNAPVDAAYASGVTANTQISIMFIASLGGTIRVTTVPSIQMMMGAVGLDTSYNFDIPDSDWLIEAIVFGFSNPAYPNYTYMGINGTTGTPDHPYNYGFFTSSTIPAGTMYYTLIAEPGETFAWMELQDDNYLSYVTIPQVAIIVRSAASAMAMVIA